MRVPLLSNGVESRLAPLLMLLGALACSKSDDAAGAPARASASTRPSPLPPLLLPHAGRANSGMEAHAGQLPDYSREPLLAAQLELLEERFGSRRALHYHAVQLTSARQLVLLQAGIETEPLVFAFDADGTLAWTKKRPLGGVSPGSRQLTLSGGPRGMAALSWYHAPTHSVVLRLWSVDGEVLADFSALNTERCDALSVLYWPTQGWLFAASSPQGVVLQRARETGTSIWGAKGRALLTGLALSGPVALASFDGSSALLAAVGRLRDAPDAPQHLLALRIDEAGEPLWKGPLDLGVLSAPASARTRIVVSRADPGRLKLALPDQPEFRAEVGADGRVRPM